ncbi:MAG TPA: branched-chain amino acid ABC transporter substrate-binding protein [Alphaproteobacteria bacterium]|nr:branched-chain amino acid ABC transporter substrate-binding protein [Alphaproteobacteria bacterium]
MTNVTRTILTILTALIAASCSNFGKAPYQGVLRVGVVGPMSGPYTSYGGQMRYGVDQAMEDINTHGGLLDHQLRLRAVDDRCDPKRAAAIAQALVEEKVAFVVGHFCSAASIAAAPIYGQAGIVMITPSSADPALTDEAAAQGAKNVFRTIPREDMEGPALARYVLANFRGQRIGVVRDEANDRAGVVPSAIAALQAGGMIPIISEKINTGATDFSGAIARLKAADIGVIVFGGRYQEAALLLIEARRQGLNIVLGGGDTLATKEFWKLAGPAAEGTFMPLLPDPSNLLTAQHVAARLARFGIDATGYTLRAYAAVQVFAEAAKRANSLDGAAVAKSLRQGQYDTVIGTLSFDDKGDLRSPGYQVYVWHKGRY